MTGRRFPLVNDKCIRSKLLCLNLERVYVFLFSDTFASIYTKLCILKHDDYNKNMTIISN